MEMGAAVGAAGDQRRRSRCKPGKPAHADEKMRYTVSQYKDARDGMAKRDRRKVEQCGTRMYKADREYYGAEYTETRASCVDKKWVVLDRQQSQPSTRKPRMDAVLDYSAPNVMVEHVPKGRQLDMTALLWAVGRAHSCMEAAHQPTPYASDVHALCVSVGPGVYTGQVLMDRSLKPASSLSAYTVPVGGSSSRREPPHPPTMLLVRRRPSIRPTHQRRAQPRDALMVTASIVCRRDAGKTSIAHPSAMRTLMETWASRDGGTVEVRFTPPVGGWNIPEDAELRVWWVGPSQATGRPLVVDLLWDEALPAAWSAYPRLCKMHRHAPPSRALPDGVAVARHTHCVYGYQADRFEALGAFRTVNPWPGRSYEEQQRRMRRMDAHLSREFKRRLSMFQNPPGRHDPYWSEGARLMLLGGAKERVRRNAAAARIQAAWREATADPGRALCRRRLQREFEGLCCCPTQTADHRTCPGC